MLYRELEPGPALRGRVHCLWILEQDADPGAAPETILPDGRLELIFNLGAPYRQVRPSELPPQPRSFLVGQVERSLEIVPTGAVRMLGVRLEAPAVHRWLRTSLREWCDLSVALEDLARPELEELEEQLRNVPSWAERIRLVQEGLARTFVPRPLDPLEGALALIRRTHGTLDLAQVAERCGMSRRTLDRRFREGVGLSPKLFARQVRLQRVFELLAHRPQTPLSQLALDAGFFDQAHLNREFREFTGRSPLAFLGAQHELSDHLTGLV